MSKKDKKQKRMPESVMLSIREWEARREKEIPDDWKSKIAVWLEKLQDSILIEEVDASDVNPILINKFINWKAKLDEMMKKVDSFILQSEKFETQDDVETYIKNLRSLIFTALEIKKLIGKENWRQIIDIRDRLRKKFKNPIDSSKKERSEFEKKKRIYRVSVRRDKLMIEFQKIVIEFIKFLDYKIEIEYKKDHPEVEKKIKNKRTSFVLILVLFFYLLLYVLLSFVVILVFL